MTSVLAVGECMLELRHATDHDLRLDFAGDTYNTAVYLARTAKTLGANVDVGYLTGVGQDPYSRLMRQAWRREGITDLSIPIPDRVPGLYTVRTDSAGERTFTYWRQQSAAAQLFSGDDWVEHIEADLVHVSGISLQLMTPRSRSALAARLSDLRAAGGRVSFDTNYRPSGWNSPTQAAAAITELAAVSDVVLATWQDEQALFGDETIDVCARRYRANGADEVIVKAGSRGAHLLEQGHLIHVPAAQPSQVVDTTAAGDSFAGSYLAGRLADLPPIDAAHLAAEVAAVVVANRGAIIPPDIHPSTVPPGHQRVPNDDGAESPTHGI